MKMRLQQGQAQHCLWANKGAALCKISAVQVSVFSSVNPRFQRYASYFISVNPRFQHYAIILSALIQGSALCKNLQELLAISTILRLELFKTAVCEAPSVIQVNNSIRVLYTFYVLYTHFLTDCLSHNWQLVAKNLEVEYV